MERRDYTYEIRNCAQKGITRQDRAEMRWMTCVRSAGKLFLDDEPDGCMVYAEIVVDHDVLEGQ